MTSLKLRFQELFSFFYFSLHFQKIGGSKIIKRGTFPFVITDGLEAFESSSLSGSLCQAAINRKIRSLAYFKGK